MISVPVEIGRGGDEMLAALQGLLGEIDQNGSGNGGNYFGNGPCSILKAGAGI